jgi:uncharacterized membrane protein YoaK (UPF0700 family)
VAAHDGSGKCFANRRRYHSASFVAGALCGNASAAAASSASVIVAAAIAVCASIHP